MADWGVWGAVIRTVAEHDPGRYAAALHWSAGEALRAYEERLRDQAREDYRTALLAWAALAAAGATKQKKPPEPPSILKD